MMDELDTLKFSEYLYNRNIPALGFRARSRKEAEAWQRALRKELGRLLGGFPSRKVPLAARVVERKFFPGYTREKIVFRTRDHLSAVAYFLLPCDFARPGPVVVCIPGHGRGCNDIVGIKADGSMRKNPGGYQKDFALQCVANGYAALAVEQLAFGHRRDEATRKRGAQYTSCQPAAGVALLFGQTMLGWRAYDVTRAIDYLCQRPEVDGTRIGCMGISGGGTTTFFAAALDARIKATVVSGAFNTFKDSILTIGHCIDNYVPWILKYAEMYDLAGLIAPRAFFIEGGRDDPIFPVRATEFAFTKAKKIYRVFGAEERFGKEIFSGKHEFHGKGAFKFLRRWL